MDPLPPPLAFLLLLFSGWINRQQQDVIDYLLEENRVLRAAHGHHAGPHTERFHGDGNDCLCRRMLTRTAVWKSKLVIHLSWI